MGSELSETHNKPQGPQPTTQQMEEALNSLAKYFSNLTRDANGALSATQSEILSFLNRSYTVNVSEWAVYQARKHQWIIDSVTERSFPRQINRSSQTAKREPQTVHALKATDNFIELWKKNQLFTNTDHLVILVHGIRTHAEWQNKLKNLIETLPNTRTIEVKYGYFDIVRFMTPFIWRSGPINHIKNDIDIAISKNPQSSISIIAHSFGTYSVAKTLENNKLYKIRYLILCGSIAPRSTDWDKISNRVSQRIVNECSTLDIWPFLAERCTWGFSDTGYSGVGGNNVYDRTHQAYHSDYLTADFAQKYWIPLFTSGTLVKTDSNPIIPKYHRWLGIIIFLIWYTLYSILLYLLISQVTGWNIKSLFTQNTLAQATVRHAALQSGIEEIIESNRQTLIPWHSIKTQADREAILIFTDKFATLPQIFASDDPYDRTTGMTVDVDISVNSNIDRVFVKDVYIRVNKFIPLAPTITYGAVLQDKPTLLIEMSPKQSPLPWLFHASKISNSADGPYYSFEQKSLELSKDNTDCLAVRIVSRDRGVYVFDIFIELKQANQAATIKANDKPIPVAFFRNAEPKDADFRFIRQRHDRMGGIMKQLSPLPTNDLTK